MIYFIINMSIFGKEYVWKIEGINGAAEMASCVPIPALSCCSVSYVNAPTQHLHDLISPSLKGKERYLLSLNKKLISHIT